MGDMVIVAYKPKEGMGGQLRELVKNHVPFLGRLGLVTDRKPMAMMSNDGTIIEVFEWEVGGISKAHENVAVNELWEKFSKVCDYVPIGTLPEAQNIFSQFKPID